METLSAFSCAGSAVLAAPSIHHDLIAVSGSARAAVSQLFHSAGTTVTTSVNCAKRSIECNLGAEAMHLAADKLSIGFEKYTIMIPSFAINIIYLMYNLNSFGATLDQEERCL